MPMPDGSTIVITMGSSEDNYTNLRTIEIKKPRLDINDDPTYQKGATANEKAEEICESGVFLSSKGAVYDTIMGLNYKTVDKTPIVTQIQAREHKAKRNT